MAVASPLLRWLVLTVLAAVVVYFLALVAAAVAFQEPTGERPDVHHIAVPLYASVPCVLLYGTVVAEPELHADLLASGVAVGLPSWLADAVVWALAVPAVALIVSAVYAPLVAPRLPDVGPATVLRGLFVDTAVTFGVLAVLLGGLVVAGALTGSLLVVGAVAALAYLPWSLYQPLRLAGWGRKLRGPTEREVETVRSAIDESSLGADDLRILELDGDTPSPAVEVQPVGPSGLGRLWVDGRILAGDVPHSEVSWAYLRHVLGTHASDWVLGARLLRATTLAVALVALVDAIPPAVPWEVGLVLLAVAVLAWGAAWYVVWRRIRALDERVAAELGAGPVRRAMAAVDTHLATAGWEEYYFLHPSAERRRSALPGASPDGPPTARK